MTTPITPLDAMTKGTGEMKVTLDRGICNGYGNCVIEAPEVFDLDDDGLGVVLDEHPPEDQREAVDAAVRTCPVQAIVVADD